jgi:uroporphyrinogen-III decarboxylase
MCTTGPDDLAARVPKSMDVKDKLAHVLKAVETIKEELKGRVPLIGFR